MLGRLLEEVSWEGHARIYRQGGRGRENVLSAEALQLLNALPRTHFLGAIVEALHGGKPESKALLRSEIEEATLELLPGDIGIVQPDGLLESKSVYGFIEAKRLRPSSFMPHQLARELVSVSAEAQRVGRRPLLILVLAKPPPVPIQRQGRKSLRDAIEPHLAGALKRLPASTLTGDELRASIDSAVSWITWGELQEVVVRGAAFYGSESSGDRAVRRQVTLLDKVLEWHDKEP
jgi:hypothetical protein